jgi:DNA-binding transcriptional ArsR family regulator
MRKRLDVETLKRASRMLRCISHPDRLRLVESLEARELSVGELMARLRLDQAAVSKHLAVLKGGGIVASRVRGNFRYYSISYPNVLNVLNCIRNHGGGK